MTLGKFLTFLSFYFLLSNIGKQFYTQMVHQAHLYGFQTGIISLDFQLQAWPDGEFSSLTLNESFGGSCSFSIPKKLLVTTTETHFQLFQLFEMPQLHGTKHPQPPPSSQCLQGTPWGKGETRLCLLPSPLIYLIFETTWLKNRWKREKPTALL